MNSKFLKKLPSYISIIFLSLGFCLSASRFATASTSSILIDADSGKVLSSSAADKLRYPASLTKLMTLYITFDALEKGLIKMDDNLPVSRNAANRSPSKLGLRAGEKISVHDAIMALVIKSANDCATVLAEGLGYTEANFANTMTQVAHELGMKNTTFKNASGLPNKAQKTTARDMAILGAAVYHHFPQYYKLFSAKKFTYKGRTYYTHNHVLKSFEGADGMKTGFTNAAGFNIITSAERDGKRVIAVTMGHNTAKLRDKKVSSMMDQGLKKLALLDTDKNRIEPDSTIRIASAVPRKAPKTKSGIQNKDTGNQAAGTITATAQTDDKNWAIQIGAFSNYAKARNYAMIVKKETNLADKDIYIEPHQAASAIVYRSKLTGFAKKEANNTCNSLKKSNKSCIVIASDKQQLVLANKF